MTDAIKDLWPDDFGASDLVTPLIVLKQQAALLGPKTNNLVEAEVTSGASGPTFVHTLYLVAPALDSYRYKLLTLSHQIELYPANVTYHPMNAGYTAVDQGVLMQILQEKFAEEKTKSLIRALIAQSRE